MTHRRLPGPRSREDYWSELRTSFDRTTTSAVSAPLEGGGLTHQQTGCQLLASAGGATPTASWSGRVMSPSVPPTAGMVQRRAAG